MSYKQFYYTDSSGNKKPVPLAICDPDKLDAKADLTNEEQVFTAGEVKTNVLNYLENETRYAFPDYEGDEEQMAADGIDDKLVAQTQVTQLAQDVRKLEGEESTITSGAVEGGKIYNVTLTNASDQLAITSIETSVYETMIYLSIGSAVEEPVSLPDTYKSIGTPSFESGKDYVIGILNGILISNEVTTN